ncbi:Ribosome recycling factor [Rhynchospora pubera]|uniref:Ribosome-recycling factor, chloroplastic n=1 Tax=Rhynchospora pubera TaxID=906938 RepID=A0AAV8ENJ3_9POAL|nr:Ribosome recycling factor [Rhynchospora pubera]
MLSLSVPARNPYPDSLSTKPLPLSLSLSLSSPLRSSSIRIRIRYRVPMAALQPFSPASAHPRLSLPSPVSRPHRLGCHYIVNSSISRCSFSKYARMQEGGRIVFFYNPLLIQISHKREVVTHATIEEIQAEKSIVEGSAKEKMDKAIEVVEASFNTVRTGRSNPAMLDRIEVEYYGTPVGLNTIAQISTPDGTSLLVQPYDKSSLKEIEKAIVKANLGMTPTNDGQVIRLTLPPLTSERRKELLKVVGKLTEEGKVAIRNIRRDAIKAYDKLEKEKKLSKDNVKDLSDDLQKLTDQYIKKVDSLRRDKEKELMTI